MSPFFEIEVEALSSLEISAEIEFEVYCGTCGSGLCQQSEADRGNARPRKNHFVRVEACKKCVDVARQDGYDEGHSIGYDEGHSIGYSKGYEEGAEVESNKAR